ncbi:phosphate transport system substrate-binding protein [Deinococcus metalli]|uniref:Phosphate-binding protein n=1 Tax=Deinococcus metalli TaxID=1141878 RepID=A0A7W8NS72_9DEIO|nr:phosphate ABC transporter substrate-binding protein PstS [Deinococcus metalli]MBB5378635.1 phosphate transport system substrate-binding protein [Deinococcus metalli]GHF61296.1 phosphate-binding protein [Deinococcus metalli]
MTKHVALIALTLSTGASALTVTGAGSSFVYPLFSKMFDQYHSETGDTVNYQSVGSGAGQKQLHDRTIDFAASDVAVPATDVAGYPGKIITFPDAIGAVVPSYNLPGVTASLKFTGPVLADIYLGKIKVWNDPQIAKLNPGVTLPPLPVTVARRSDGSGTTGVFTDYLSKVSPEWKSKVGSATSVEWPVGVGGKGNDGVSGIVKSTPGAIGYIELTYALQNKIDFGSVQNRAGQFVKADLASVKAAAASVSLPSAGIISITNASGSQSYPISTYTYVIVYQDQKYGNRTPQDAAALKKLLMWVVTKGQAYNTALNYVALPSSAQTRALVLISGMTYGGQPIAK